MVDALKVSAKKADWIVIGCDKLRNRMEDHDLANQMEDEVLDDIFDKLPHDPRRVYLAGFSGGAMRAYGISARRTEKIAGIIAYGGWLGGRKYKNEPYCKYMAVAIVNGDDDLGAKGWAKQDAKVLKRRKCRVKEFDFSGGHTIAPPHVTDDCINWLQECWEKTSAKQN